MRAMAIEKPAARRAFMGGFRLYDAAGASVMAARESLAGLGS
jgi:hypothetical protein